MIIFDFFCFVFDGYFFKRLCKEYICDPGFISVHFQKIRLKTLPSLLLSLL